KTAITSTYLSLNHHFRALEVEAEAHFAQAGLRHRVTQAGLIFSIEHQEAAAARADQLAAERAVLHRHLIPRVNLAIAHSAAALLLILPVDIHQFSELPEVARLQRLLALIAELLDEMQILDHALVALPALIVLLLQNARSRAAVAGEEQQQIIFEI